MTISEIIDKVFEHSDVEAELCRLWEAKKIYKYDPNSKSKTFSVNTPPPYVSAAHLHVGHAMSYIQQLTNIVSVLHKNHSLICMQKAASIALMNLFCGILILKLH